MILAISLNIFMAIKVRPLKSMIIICLRVIGIKEVLIKKYDLLKPTRCLIEEKQRYLKLEHEDSITYAAYFAINSIVGELDFQVVKSFITSNNNLPFRLIPA